MRIGHGGEMQALSSFFRPSAETRQRPAEARQRSTVAQPQNATASQRVAGEQSSSLQLTVTTAEGDTVTLSAQALSAFALESSEGRRSASTNQELSLSVSIEGDLNQEELADIRKLALALGKSVRQAERGNMAKALRTVARASDEDTIAAFQFRFERRTELSYRQSAYERVSDLS